MIKVINKTKTLLEMIQKPKKRNQANSFQKETPTNNQRKKRIKGNNSKVSNNESVYMYYTI